MLYGLLIEQCSILQRQRAVAQVLLQLLIKKSRSKWMSRMVTCSLRESTEVNVSHEFPVVMLCCGMPYQSYLAVGSPSSTASTKGGSPPDDMARKVLDRK